MTLPDEIAELCRRRNIRVERAGEAWRFRGIGVDVAVVDLRHIRPADLRPFRPTPHDDDR